MKDHNEEEVKSYDYIYYLVGIISGLFTGIVIDKSLLLTLILGLFGLLFAAFFLTVFVKGRGEKA
jgi:hypothetical protein